MGDGGVNVGVWGGGAGVSVGVGGWGGGGGGLGGMPEIRNCSFAIIKCRCLSWYGHFV